MDFRSNVLITEKKFLFLHNDAMIPLPWDRIKNGKLIIGCQHLKQELFHRRSIFNMGEVTPCQCPFCC